MLDPDAAHAAGNYGTGAELLHVHLFLPTCSGQNFQADVAVEFIYLSMSMSPEQAAMRVSVCRYRVIDAGLHVNAD